MPQPWCSSLHPCGFDQQCAPPPSTGDPAHTDPGPRCQPRPCPGGKCTAFHLELVAQDDVQAIVHVYYDYSPIPDSTFSLENPSLSHYKVAAGVRWAITPAWRVALTYYLNIFVPRDIDNSTTTPPTNVQGEGYSHSPGLEVAYRF